MIPLPPMNIRSWSHGHRVTKCIMSRQDSAPPCCCGCLVVLWKAIKWSALVMHSIKCSASSCLVVKQVRSILRTVSVHFYFVSAEVYSPASCRCWLVSRYSRGMTADHPQLLLMDTSIVWFMVCFCVLVWVKDGNKFWFVIVLKD